MSEKTIGQIAAEAYEKGNHAENVSYDDIWETADKNWRLHWEAAASVIWNKAVEECAKQICAYCEDGDLVHQEADEFGKVDFYHNVHNGREAVDCDASSILSLKKGNTDERG